MSSVVYLLACTVTVIFTPSMMSCLASYDEQDTTLMEKNQKKYIECHQRQEKIIILHSGSFMVEL